ncbi:c2 domain-containing protein [Phthorimaea operculella]|nr:c2 domain-containing protein [Phthorimaea operculella]
MRRSAQGPAPRTCLVCGEEARLLAPLRTCAICRNSACHKCVIDSPSHSQSNGSRTPLYIREQYICNLCAETREMWKKSGAWFFKSLPKYILPERRNTGRYTDTELARSLQDAGNSSNEGKTDSEPGSPLSIHAPTFSRQPSSIERRSIPSPHDSHYEWTETDLLSHGISGLSLHRTDSLNQRPLTLKRTGSKGSAYSLRSVKKDPTKSERAPTIPDAGFGTLEIKLAYDNSASSLAVTVLRARGLIGMDMTGLSDPFCRLEVLPPEGTYSNRLRTKTVHKTKNPEFNETLHFFGITESDLASKTLEIVLFDDDRYGCDEMGSASVSLRECAKSPMQMRLALSGSSNSEPAGPRVLLALCYSTKKRALVVTVCRAADLPPQDSNGYSDPFVKLHLEPDPYHKKHKSSIKWRNLNPVWNEEFLFETRPTELSRQNLTLTVWDKDYGKPNDFLGSLVLGASNEETLGDDPEDAVADDEQDTDNLHDEL